MSADGAMPRQPAKACELCGHAMPDGTCRRQGCRAARLYWARRAERERAERERAE